MLRNRRLKGQYTSCVLPGSEIRKGVLVMKKRLGILALAAALLVQSAAFVPSFAEDATPTAKTATTYAVPANYEVLEQYKDGTNCWTAGDDPWGIYMRIAGNWWVKSWNGSVATGKNPDGTEFSYKALAPVQWQDDTQVGGWMHVIPMTLGGKAFDMYNDPYVGGAMMTAGTGQTVLTVAKAFTAPKDGIVRIGSDYEFKGNNEGDVDNIIASCNSSNGEYVKISNSNDEVLLDKTQFRYDTVANEDGTSTRVYPDGMREGYGKFKDAGYKATLLQYETCYRIKKGETLYFEVGNMNMDVVSGQQHINWTPVVDYIDIAPEYGNFTYDANGASFTLSGNVEITADDMYIEFWENGKYKENVEITNFKYDSGAVSLKFASKLGAGHYKLFIENISYTDIMGETTDLSNTFEFDITAEPEKNSFAWDMGVWSNDPVNGWSAYKGNWNENDTTRMNNGFMLNIDLCAENIGGGANPYIGWVWADSRGFSGTDHGAVIKTTQGGVFINKELMSVGSGVVPNSGDKQNYASMGYRVAKGFTAPYSGKVTVSQKNILGTGNENEILSSSDTETQIGIKITKNASREKIWPENEDDVTIGGANCKYAFEPIEVEVKKGDTLYFEAMGKKWANINQGFVHWNPVVTYTDIAVNAAFTDNSGSELTTAAALAASKSAKLKLWAFDAAGAADAVPVVALYNANGALVKVVFGNTLGMDVTASNVMVELGDLSALGVASAKAMLWSADGTMKPLTSVIAQVQ